MSLESLLTNNLIIMDSENSDSNPPAMPMPTIQAGTALEPMNLTSDPSSSDSDLASMTREELEDKVRKLRTHVQQLRNVILKRKFNGHISLASSLSDASLDSLSDQNNGVRRKKRKQERPFDFKRSPKRHVALKIAYLGWSYDGLAAQEDSEQTIEAYLFEALTKAKLIESRATSNYHRCGRTDKGVSAFSQVISIDVRCKSLSGVGVIPAEITDKVSNSLDNSDVKEVDYCKLLNRLLPRDIRVLAWAPVRRDFSARFDCVRRTYKYYFPASVDLDIQKMKNAAQHLIGTNDFRNFCKKETGQAPDRIKSTIRTILKADIQHVETLPNLYMLTIEGQSFIWHQIRCIVGILIPIGQGLEEPSLVQQMLDVTTNPKKPQYAMAVDYPLVLFDVDHGSEIKEWKYDDAEYVMGDFQKLRVQHAIKTAMITDMMNTFNHQCEQSNTEPIKPLSEDLNSLVMGSKSRIYQKVMSRPTCERS